MHLLIPFAAAASEASNAAFNALTLPYLNRLMPYLALQRTDAGSEYTQSPPHERAIAACYGLSAADGCIAWAAHDLAHDVTDPPRHGYAQGQAWAQVTPCHWRVGVDNITMTDPRNLQLSEADSKALLAAMQPYFQEDGIALHYDQPAQWFAQSPLFEDLATASLDRVIGRNINPWMPESPQAAPLRRLYNEMQMLLYTHPVNEARQAAGLAPVNAFWVSGTGSLKAPSSQSEVQVVNSLREHALNEDWPRWAAAWQLVDSTHLAQACQHIAAGGQLQLVLCGERNTLHYQSQNPSFLSKIKGLLGLQPLYSMRGQL